MQKTRWQAVSHRQKRANNGVRLWRLLRPYDSSAPTTISTNDVHDGAASVTRCAIHAGILRQRPATSIKQRLKLFPLDNFSSSVYSVPVLLLLRLFYQAGPFEKRCSENIHETSGRMNLASHAGSTAVAHPASPQIEHTSNHHLDVFSTPTVAEFVDQCICNPELSSCLVASITWIKALASPLSHEYLQIIVFDKQTMKRYRITAERSERGDIMTVGWDWSSGQYASLHHVLPLPLLTLSYEDTALRSRPTLTDLAHILAASSNSSAYNLMREMCWWYAEKVFNQTISLYPNAGVKPWPFANLRYSFVVRNQWFQRRRLVSAAEEFRLMNTNSLSY